MNYTWHFLDVLINYKLLMVGLLGTLKLVAISFVAGGILGVILGMARSAGNRAARYPATVFVQIFCNTPGLIQLMWFFYVVPILTGTQQDIFFSAAISLSCNFGAYTAEIIRGGIRSVAHGQWEAARAIGMTYPRIMRHVILPQAVRRMVPALTNRTVELTKSTAIAATLGYADLLYQGQLISAALYTPIEAFTVVAIIYIILLSVLSFAAGQLERHLHRFD